MRRNLKTIALMLVIIAAAGTSLNAQRAMRGMMMDSVRMNRMKMAGQRAQDSGRYFRHDSLWMRGYRHPMPPFAMERMHRNMFPDPEFWMGRPMWWDRRADRMWRYPMPYPGHRMDMMHHRGQGWGFDRVPNLTDKQRKEINDLRSKQREEMQKLRDEMSAKMKSLRDSHRQKIMELLTPEQKKWVEENMGNPPEKTN